jgi:hypothetical protein
MSSAEPSTPPLLTTDRPIAGRPILVAGPSSAAILGADGTFSLRWDTRGAPLEWGGVYAQGVRLTGPWSVSIGGPDGEVPLGPSTLRHLTHERWSVVSEHLVSGCKVTDSVIALHDGPGVGRRLRVVGPPQEVVPVHLELPLWLAPVLIEGVRPYDFEVHATPTGTEARSHGWGFCLHASPPATARAIDGRRIDGPHWEGVATTLSATYQLPLDAVGEGAIDWVLVGGLRGIVDWQTGEASRRLAGADGWMERARAPWDAWRAQVPQLRLPDDPGLEAAYGLATDALRALYTDPEPGMSGLVAGYPWYAALWFRDLAWMLPAVLWLGDVDRVESSLATSFRYQAPADLGLLGASKGELPMQLSPGPVFLFGTSDTTLYYPEIVHRLVRHTGDAGRATPYREGVARAIAWGRHKVDARSGLLTNGGEVASLRKATAGAGQVHYGIDAFDTTIWDSADRRDHAIDVQVLWQAALGAASALGTLSNDPKAESMAREAAAVRSAIVALYPWPEEDYLFDSLRADGSARRDVRPNALRVVEAGLLPAEQAVRVLERAARDDLSTPWGLRTLSSRAPAYDPLAYHDGQVWTIATAWAAAAELRTRRAEVGVRYLDRIADRIRAEGGYASECYRGDRAEPFDACFLLGFSVAPFLTTIFEGLWGLHPRLEAGAIECRPTMPRSWSTAELRGVRLGAGTLDLAWTPSELTATWSGPSPVTLVGDSGSVVLAPGVPGRLGRSPSSPTS